MADVPDINPLKQIWPRRRDEQGPGQHKRRPPKHDEDGESSESEEADKPTDKGDGHIDEYV